MRFGDSQKQLIEIAQTPVTRAELMLVAIEEHQSGVSRAVDYCQRQSKRDDFGPRSIVLEASRPWCAVVGMAMKAETSGRGYFALVYNACVALAGAEKRDLVIWLEESRLMKPAERELIWSKFEAVHRKTGINIRLVFLNAKVMVWDYQTRSRKAAFPAFSNRLKGRTQCIVFRRDYVTQMDSGEKANLFEKIA